MELIGLAVVMAVSATTVRFRLRVNPPTESPALVCCDYQFREVTAGNTAGVSSIQVSGRAYNIVLGP